MRKVKMMGVMSVLVAVFFLSNGFAFAQDWVDDPSAPGTLVNTNQGPVKVKTSGDMGELKIGSYAVIKSFMGWGAPLTEFYHANNQSIWFMGKEIWFNPNGVGGNVKIQPEISSMTVSDMNFFVSNGRVGIGTTDPGDYELAVEGEIGARKIVVTMDSWSDYVFNEDYALPSLDKVETYIKENKHLPDIPSEKEIKETGLSVADMMAKQMQKIEELTLYVIDLKKENEKLSGRLASLEKDK